MRITTIKADIIIGSSFFSEAPMVAITSRGGCDTSDFTRFIDRAGKHGRPATVVRDRGSESIATFIQRWEDWAAKEGFILRLNRKPRRVANPI